jgi:diguanylate cyclase (GGDEF)-like protein
MKFGIRTKVLGSFLGLSLIFFMALGIVLLEVREINITTGAVQEEAHKFELSDRLQLRLHMFLDPANNYLITGNVDERDRFDQLSNEIFQITKDLQGYHGDQRWEALATDLNHDVLRLSEMLVTILFIDRPVGNPKGAKLLHEATIFSGDMIKKADEFRVLSEKEMIRMVHEAQSKSQNVTWVFSGIVGATVIFFALLSFYLTRFVIWPILDLHRGAKTVGQGNLDYRLTIKTNDEIESLAGEFNQMVEAISGMKKELDNKIELTHQLAITDSLTALYNRRFFMEKLREEIKRNERFGHPLSLILIDVDDFKTYNDTQGHLKGDDLLRSLAVIFKKHVRSVDFVCRIGGEEFMVILPETNFDAAVKIAEGLRTAVEYYPFADREKQPGGKLTISLGVASSTKGEKDILKILKAVDDALYHAKRTGKNKIGIIK